ncbi:DegT/DnrJ/EryC1/StrS aminotransferase family protein [cf. Phormidesmis sp. LEGE 11477]|uniref:DegT/DnrJ/EryC1/StrS family aminotransferase n=1 Tax=cf. Phormidesmis sp. LEGE 11477 TaxID=1828680 RepID=UPI00187E7851|nr:DegT/DnrJ/EryC1/StrS family aminotransferase [cf. Phormidesmis sp. LEGE 11477]MBE9060417.1 DegT/DnrJ/EryC1/StrS family aminotransferase [cf. Phormidesmis sp. LEGE 11477]
MIKFVDLDWQHRLLRESLEQAFYSVFESNSFIGGSQVDALESEFARLHHCKYGVGTKSGTDALVVALRALNIGAGDEVIVPAMTFFATAEAVCIVGATPVFVDVEPITLGIEPTLAETAITEKTKAIILVHLHGWPVPLAPFLAIAQKHNLALVEDCAQAHGASENGHLVGSRTQVACFSFFPGKNIGALGDSGMVITNHQKLAETVRILANHGRQEKYLHTMVGYNARINEMQAAFINVKLPYMHTWNDKRQSLAAYYNRQLADMPLQLPPAFDEHRLPCFHLYVIHCSSQAVRDNLQAFLEEKEIATGIHYPVPLHLQPAFRQFSCQPMPVAEKAASCILSLPIYPGMKIEQQDYVIEQIKQFFSQ